jgi:hypothetical protein
MIPEKQRAAIFQALLALADQIRSADSQTRRNALKAAFRLEAARYERLCSCPALQAGLAKLRDYADAA